MVALPASTGYDESGTHSGALHSHTSSNTGGSTCNKNGLPFQGKRVITHSHETGRFRKAQLLFFIPNVIAVQLHIKLLVNHGDGLQGHHRIPLFESFKMYR